MSDPARFDGGRVVERHHPLGGPLSLVSHSAPGNRPLSAIPGTPKRERHAVMGSIQIVSPRMLSFPRRATRAVAKFPAPRGLSALCLSAAVRSVLVLSGRQWGRVARLGNSRDPPLMRIAARSRKAGRDKEARSSSAGYPPRQGLGREEKAGTPLGSIDKTQLAGFFRAPCIHSQSQL